MSSIFKYIPHIIIILLLGLFIFGILKGCQNIQSPTEPVDTTLDDDSGLSDTNQDDDNEASLDDLFEEGEGETGEEGNDENESLTSKTDEDEGEGATSSTDQATASSSGSSSTTSSSGTSTLEKYLVIAGSFTSEANAKRELTRLKKLGYPDAEVVEFDQSQYYSLCAGRYASLSEARGVKVSLVNNHKFEAYVHKMRGKKVRN